MGSERGEVVLLLWLAVLGFAQDADGDGVPDAVDACPGHDDRIDHDFDAIPSGCELQPVGAPWDWRVHRLVHAAGPVDVQAIDVDFDGDLDLVRAHTHGVDVLDNQGGLSFATEVPLYSQAVWIYTTEAGDADGDGDTDLVYVDLGRGTVGVLENLCGALVRGPIVGMGLSEPAQAELLDVDGDGDTDVTVTSHLAGPWVFEATPTGFAPGVLTNAFGTGSHALGHGDMDSDGIDDAVVSELYDQGRAYWLDWAAWSFTEQVFDTQPGSYYDTSAFTALTVADFTSDGEPDVMAADDDEIRMYRNLGAGASFNSAVADDSRLNVWELIADDVDADGDIDALVGGIDGLYLLQNDFPGFTLLDIPTALPLAVQGMAYADLDNDGIPDLAGTGIWDAELEVLGGLGGGTWSSAFTMVPDTPTQPEGVAATDLDGDGWEDVVVTEFDGDRLTWHRNLGAGQFGPRQDIVTGRSRLGRVHPADIGGDGDVDLFTASPSGGLLWIEATGPATFAPEVELDPLVGFYGLDTGDIDGDGDLDLVASGWTYPDGLVRWYRNDGGSWTAQADVASATWLVADVELVDLGGDPARDLVWASADDGVYWAENLGGTFGPPQLVASVVGGFTWAGVEAADFDGDGDRDLAWAADAGTAVLQTAENLGGSFAAPVDVDPGGPDPMNLTVGDLDQDGALDLVVTGHSGTTRTATIWVHRGDGAGTFDPRIEVGRLGYQVVQAVLFDADQDLDLDVLHGSRIEHDVVWLENPLNDPPDADGDGLWEDEELARGLDPTLVDTDGDGLTDGAEVFRQGGPTVVATTTSTPTTPGLSPCASPPATGTGTGSGTGTGTGSTGTTPTGTPGTATGTLGDSGMPSDGRNKPGPGCSCSNGTGSALWLWLLVAFASARRPSSRGACGTRAG